MIRKDAETEYASESSGVKARATGKPEPQKRVPREERPATAGAGKRGWTWLLLPLLLSCGFVFFSVCYYKSTHSGPFWEKYQTIHIGMERKAVIAILGPPNEIEQAGGSGAGEDLIWQDGKQRICVQFDAGDFAYRKSFTP